MSRTQKFNKLLIHNKNPDYQTIKNLYTSGKIQTIATASKLLSMVKYKKNNTVFKVSEQNKKKLDSIISEYGRVIKKDMTIDQMNKALSNNLSSASKSKINDIQINRILSNLKSDSKYYLEVLLPKKDSKIVTINRDKKGFRKYLNNEYLTSSSLHGGGSDAEIDTVYKSIKGYKIVEINGNVFDDEQDTKRRKMNRNNGKFLYHNKHEGVDLSKYQIYKKDDIKDNKNCLIYSLEKAGVDKIIINNMIVKYSDVSQVSQTDICFKTFEYIQHKDFDKIAVLIGRQISVEYMERQIKNKVLTNRQIKTKIFGEYVEGVLPIFLGTHENHIFNIEETKYKKYAITNYEQLKNKKDWFKYSGKDTTSRGKYLNSLELVVLIEKLEYFKPFKLEITDEDQLIKLSTSDLLDNIENDQRLFNYSTKESRKQNIYFGDLENINNVDQISTPFLSGIVNINSNKDPKIYTGINCINQMLDYVFVNNKFGIDNIIYFHNMKYDFSLMKQNTIITNICEKNNQIYSVNLLYKKVKITLKDSYKVFNESLVKFTKAFNLDPSLSKKEAINYNYYQLDTINHKTASIKMYKKGIKEHEKELFLETVKPFIDPENNKRFFHMDYYRYYLKYDCLVLKEGMIKYNQTMINTFGKPIFDFLTISSYADDYFKNKGVYDETYEVCAGLKQFIGLAVYGGRVNCNQKYIKQVINELVQDYDGVSLYPSSIDRQCRENGYVKGKAKRITSHIDYKTQDNFIIQIQITAINKKQQNPFIARKTKDSLQYINEIPEDGLYVVIDKTTLEDYIQFHEIEYKFIDGIYWNEGYNNKFKCILDVFNERKEQKALKTSEGDIKQNLIKLIMNSAYGKTLLKSENEKDNIINSEDFNNYLYNNFNTIKHCKKINDKQYLITHSEQDESYNRAHIGVSVLSMSKRIMNEVMSISSDNNINIYYQDTDSMHMPDNEVKKLEDLFRDKYNRELTGKGLGQFHTDFSVDDKQAKNVISKNCIFLGKKSYIDMLKYEDKDGETQYTVHKRMKGINDIAIKNASSVYDDKTEADRIFSLYKDLANNQTIEFVLNPETKPSFKFTSQGVQLIKTGTFKREINFQ